MKANDRFRKWLEDACPEARQWVKDRSLVQAWRDCPNGCWMAWWVFSVCHDWNYEVNLDLRSLFPEGSIYSGTCFTVEQQRRFAAIMRANYTPTGKRRTR